MTKEEISKLNEKELERKDYTKYYSESGLWEKIKNYAKIAGKRLILEVLKLYYAMSLNKVSEARKILIIGALGYFILPIDLVPDFIPGVGYLDDAAIIAAVIALVAAAIDDEVSKRAKEKLKEWFD